jgi:hypothetical protein
MNIQEVYVVMAIERTRAEFLRAESPPPDTGHTCYCVCDSAQTARKVIEKDTAHGDIHPGARVELHVIQTKELV